MEEIIKEGGKLTKIPWLRIFSWVFAGVVTVLSLGGIFALAPLTMVPWWFPAIVAAFSGSVLGIAGWRTWSYLTTIEHFLPNYLLNLLICTIWLTAFFYYTNDTFLSGDEPQKEMVVVKSKYRERHHTSRRTGKHSYVRGPDYYTYHVTVDFLTGEQRTLKLPYSTYKNIRQDAPLILSLQRGIFGVDVIQTSSIPYDNPVPAPRPRGHCRFFGTSGDRAKFRPR